MISRDRLHGILDRAPETPVVVVGDLIADRYVMGSSGRVSREAPVLILRYLGEKTVPGGAANAAMNLRALGAPVRLVGVVGEDAAGAELLACLREAGCDLAGVRATASRGTTVKTRILAGDAHVSRQQVVRIDRDQPDQLEPGVELELLGALERALAGARGVLLSDYGQGVLAGELRRRALATARERGLVSCADSRRRLEAFRGVTTATPNESEALPAVPAEARSSLGEAARFLLKTLEARSLIITRGSSGMEIYQGGGEPLRVGVVGGVEVVDVTGAGDTVSAAVVLALACGADAHEAAVIASHAAGVVVGKRGTATASAAEVRASLSERWDES